MIPCSHNITKLDGIVFEMRPRFELFECEPIIARNDIMRKKIVSFRLKIYINRILRGLRMGSDAMFTPKMERRELSMFIFSF